MPILLLVLFAVFGVGYFARQELRGRPVPAAVATIAPAHTEWARACQARLAEVARDFEVDATTPCHPGHTTITTLPSGVDYVEYSLRAPDGSVYQVTVTEEPQNAGEPSGWRGAPGCRGSYREFEVVRHDNGRLALVHAESPRGLEFAKSFEPAANFCIEEAR
jgi:hypothetical protein